MKNAEDFIFWSDPTLSQLSHLNNRYFQEKIYCDTVKMLFREKSVDNH